VAARIVKLTPGFARARLGLGLSGGSARGIALARCLRSLADSATLPGPVDVEVEFRPGTAFARRAGSANLWIWYRFDDQLVSVLSVTDVPPVPREG
jgi:hypothetical protein